MRKQGRDAPLTDEELRLRREEADRRRMLEIRQQTGAGATREWVTTMLEGISSCLEQQGYRLSNVQIPPLIWDTIAHDCIDPSMANVRPEAVRLHVGSDYVELRRGVSMAIGWWAVPL